MTGTQNARVSTFSARPACSPELARELARERFSLAIEAVEELPSERDRNFRLKDAEGESFVLKVHNVDDDRALLAVQDRVLARLETLEKRESFAVPRVLGRVDWAPTGAAPRHVVRLLSWVDGELFAKWRPRNTALCASLGRQLGHVQRALAGLEDHVDRADFVWGLERAPEAVERARGQIADSKKLRLLDTFVEAWDDALRARLARARRSWIHGDANDYNLLVDAQGMSARVSGLIDFGDVNHGLVVAEPAIAASYAGLGTEDPLAAICSVARGFHEVYELEDDEIDLFYDLVRARLCQSVSIAVLGRAAAPDNVYLSVTEDDAWRALEQLARHPNHYARARVRHACTGRLRTSTPLEVSARAEVFAGGLRGAPVLDLSFGSTELGGLEVLEDAARFDAHVARLAGAPGLAIGRYGEARPIYTEELFRAPGLDRVERRSIHLGIDVFADASTPLRAPLDARVEAIADNRGAQDYGPTLVLRHELRTEAGDQAIWTLWGHLRSDVLETLRCGQEIAAGEVFAHVGARDENGGWPPHLHFQLYVDLLGFGASAPGVAAPSEEAFWRACCPNPAQLLGLDRDACEAKRPRDSALLEERAASVNPSLSVSYDRPLHIVRGRGAYLFDASGQPYLDLVNNVCHVGHCHPHVVAAAQRQIAVLNTNTRYLHTAMQRYAARLAALMPAELECCFFSCSGSEANEVALRVAAASSSQGAAEERREVVALDVGYHGNTQALVDISGYKHDGPGGRGAPSWVRKVALPDVFRGAHRGADAGARYAADFARVVAELVAQGRPPRAFIHESILSCGGQIVLPEGYLARCYEIARAAGALCIADEVQVGFGRVGDAWWAFEEHGVVPDIVTLGKPMGNGHPLAGIVTTRSAAEAFAARGMEYFNTFGGNPVSCEIGQAVLDVIEAEGLRERAREVGRLLVDGFRSLQEDCAWLGDVRGRGLFLGLEFVEPRSLSADAWRAKYVVERMRALGFLLSTDGPEYNVIKIKPPLVIDVADARACLEAFAAVLREDAFRFGPVRRRSSC